MVTEYVHDRVGGYWLSRATCTNTGRLILIEADTRKKAMRSCFIQLLINAIDG